MIEKYPQNYTISSGTGMSVHELVAFDSALIDAGISNYNLLRVSSILPSKCTRRNKVELKPGSVLLTAYGTISSNKQGALIASAIAVGIPEEEDEIGIIMEYAGNCSAYEAEKKVCEMVEESMKRHNIKLKNIISSAVDRRVTSNEYESVISAITMW